MKINNKVFFNYLLAVFTVVIAVYFTLFKAAITYRFDLFEGFTSSLIEGMLMTLIISFVAFFSSMVIGFVLFLFERSKYIYLQALSKIITEIMLGTPLIVFILLVIYFVGINFNVSDKNSLGIIALSFYISVYMKNTFKGAISSIGNDQFIAMDLFGFTSYQKYRYIIIPQLIKQIMPVLVNNLSLVIKGSAILGTFAVNEYFHSIQSFQSKTFAFVEGYIVMWFGYLMITIPLSLLSQYIEKRVSK